MMFETISRSGAPLRYFKMLVMLSGDVCASMVTAILQASVSAIRIDRNVVQTIQTSVHSHIPLKI